MLVKVVTLFIVAMAVLAIFGRLRFPSAITRNLPRRGAVPGPRKCAQCGRYLIGKGGCDCGKPPVA